MRRWRTTGLAVLAVCCIGCQTRERSPEISARGVAEPAPLAATSDAVTAEALAATFAQLDPALFIVEDGVTMQRLADGRRVRLSIVPGLQKAVTDYVTREGKVPPHAGVVAIEPTTGRVLALVSVSPRGVEHFALRALAPAASVFKVVTASALLELANVDPTAEICYSGGLRRLTAAQVLGTGPPGDKCGNLGDALAHSLNVVVARSAISNLERTQLEEMAQRFGFNQEIPFELPVDVSQAEFSDDDVEWARTAAGFWNVDMSPLHGALIAAAIANDGVMMKPRIVDTLEDAAGHVLWRSAPAAWHTVVRPEVAKTLQQLGQGTTTLGTGAEAFAKRTDWPADLPATGKTGTLSNKVPFLLFTWFVGSAPIADPTVAVGALVALEPKWWFKGTHAAAETILSQRRLGAQTAVGLSP